VTTEQFTSGPSNSMSGSYCYAYDARGEQTGEIVSIADGASPYQIGTQYNDAGVVTQLTYPTGTVAQFLFTSQERLSEITHTASGTTTYVVHNITYNGAAGAAGKPDSYVLGGSLNACSTASPYACATLTYDNDLRLTGETFTDATGAVTDYAMTRTYDAAGNVTSVSSALPAAGGQSGGQDNQQFCYDALNRLTWAGTTGTNPCTGQAVTGTTLTNASYTASYSYDISNRITQSTLTGALAGDPQGTYTYDSTHYHAVDAIGTSAYEAQYDASGNMICRTPTGPQVCTSTTRTGASLTYDVEGRLIQWVSADGTTTVKYGYDGEGHRFEMQMTSGGTTTTTNYVAGLEDAVVSGTTDDYISYLGQRLIESNWSGTTNSVWDLLGDGLGSPTVRLGGTGVHAAQLYGPYGQLRWAGGTMVTTYGFTGQHSDVTTGLDYYGARYYDPAAGQFISADTAAGPNRYAYVADDPETLTDPTGHRYFCGDCGGGSGGSGNGSGSDPCNGYVGGHCGHHPGSGGGGTPPRYNPCGPGKFSCSDQGPGTKRSWLNKAGAGGAVQVGVGYYGIDALITIFTTLLEIYLKYGAEGNHSDQDFSALGYGILLGLAGVLAAVEGGGLIAATAELIIGTAQNIQNIESGGDSSDSQDLNVPSAATELGAIIDGLARLKADAVSNPNLAVQITEEDIYTPIYGTKYLYPTCTQGACPTETDYDHIVGWNLAQVDFEIEVFNVVDPPPGPATQG
jgi:RHS repeat-associated protein